MRRVIVGAGLWVGLVGCVSMPSAAPTEQLVDSEVSLRQAEKAGASSVPEAAQHLEWAREQTQGAHRLIQDNRRAEATLFLMRAEADAQLALALAQEAPVRAEADRLLEQVRQLQSTVQ